MIKSRYALPLLLLVVSGSAFADNMYFQSGGSNIWFNSYISVYVSPYTIKDNSQGGATMSVYCLDWNHDVNVGSTWTADILPLTPAYATSLYYDSIATAYNVTAPDGGGNISLVQSGPPTPTPSPFNRYLEAAYLFEQSMALQQDAITNPGNAAIDAEKERELNVAAWTLFISHPPADINAFTNAINNSHYGTAVYNYLQGANAAVAGGYTAAHWYAVTPDPQTGNNALQEFLTYIPPNGHIVPTVPEPAALVLLGTIVGILSLKTYRRKQRA